MNNDDDNNDAAFNERETIVSYKILPVPFLKAFVTQTDWNSRHTLESWYGHHSPFLRTIALLCLILVVTSLYYIAIVSPFLWSAMRNNGLVTLSAKQTECARSLCNVVQEMRFSCEINQDGESAKIIMDSINGTNDYSLSWSPVCQEAFVETEKLFGQSAARSEDNLAIGDFPMTIILNDELEEKKEGVERPSARPSFTTIHPSNCSISLSLSSISAAAPRLTNFSIIDEEPANETFNIPLLRVSDYKAGDVVENVLDLSTCPQAMSNTTSAVVGFIATIHTTLMGPILPVIVALVIVVVTVVMGCIKFGADIVALLFTTALVRFCFTWPKDYCGGLQITYGSTFKMLLLLNTLSMPRTGAVDDTIFAIVLAYAAYRNYKNNEAAMEWLQLGVLWYGWSSLVPYFDDVANNLKVLDGLGIIRFVGGLIAYFIPGTSWWKLVRVYIFWRAFPRRPETKDFDIQRQSGLHMD